MDIFSIKLDGWQSIVLSINWLSAVLFSLFFILVALGVNKLYKAAKLQTIHIEEATIGIGNSSITIKYDERIRRIAYKIWVELMTRKIGIRFDEENDTIVEIYNSWYEAFGVIRNLLGDVPVERIRDAKGLVELTTKVLNYGLRPHLTVWQARFRVWYYRAAKENPNLSPQEIQKEFPHYQSLIADLTKTNDIMIKYAEELRRIIDN